MNTSEFKYISSQDLTSTPTSELFTTAHSVNDHIVRLISDDTAAVFFKVYETSDVHAYFNEWANSLYRDINTLKSVVQWQHNLIDYNSIYQAFLMEQLTDDEFEDEAQKFVYEPMPVDPDELTSDLRRVYELTNIPYTPSDISSLFKCTHEDALHAISNLREKIPAISPMLPEQDQ